MANHGVCHRPALAVEGRYLKAHKMVLSLYSPYFRDLFKTSPCKHPIVFIKDVSYSTMSDLLKFMYQGEVQVSEENFTTFVETAESLQIRGLSNKNLTESLHEENKSGKEVSQNPFKRPRLSESTASGNQPEIVKTEPVATACSSSLTSEEIIPFKLEPSEQEESPCIILDDNANEDLSNDLLDDEEKNEDFCMKEGSEVGATVDGTLGEEDSIQSVIEDDDFENAPSSSIPERSKERYENTLSSFEQWCDVHDVKKITEIVLLNYFKEKSTTYKSSTLLGVYSMLRNMLLIRRNIDISKYRNLSLYLKRKNEGYKKKTTKYFTREEFERFLKEADDQRYLMMKVVAIISVAGGCKKHELMNLHVNNVIDEGEFIRIQLVDDSIKKSRELIVTRGNIENVDLTEIIRKYIKLRLPRTDHQRLFVAYREGKCTRQPIGRNAFGSVPKFIAEFLKLPNPEEYTGHCFKKMSVKMSLSPQLINFS